MPLEARKYNDHDEEVNYSPRAARIFPRPWRFEEFPEGYRVLDANGCVLAYVVANAGEQKANSDSKKLTADEAWRIAHVIASLPDLIKGPVWGSEAQRSWWRWLKRRAH